MGQDVTLTSSDGFKLGAYRADPKGAPKGAVVVIQEIFGVNHHIRAVTDRLAEEGYVAIAPAVFDRMEKNFQTGYTPDDMAKGGRWSARPTSARDAARHAGGDRCRQGRRQGRHHRLLHGRHDHVSRGRRARRA